MTRPTTEEASAYYQYYINLVPEGEIWEVLDWIHEDTQKFIRRLPQDKADFSYEEGKWTVKEVLLHMIDVERIMAYRALRFARRDKTDLPGFDENAYVPFADAKNRTLKDIADEFQAVRRSTVQQFKHFNEAMYQKRGTANKASVSVKALAYIIAGHELHHLDTIKERYL